MSAQMNELLFKTKKILGIGRLMRTEYRVLPSIRYPAEPSNRTEYRFSPNSIPKIALEDEEEEIFVYV